MDENTNGGSAAYSTGRRDYLVDWRFQLKYTLLLVALGLALSLLFGGLMYEAHVEAIRSLNLPDGYQHSITSQDTSFLWVVVAITATMTISLAIFGIVVTHRVAGPVYVFSRYVNVLGKGRYPLIRPLRKRDEFKKFYEAFRQAVMSMRNRDLDRAEELNRIAGALEAAMTQTPGVNAAMRPALSQLRLLSRQFFENAASEDLAAPSQAPAKSTNGTCH